MENFIFYLLKSGIWIAVFWLIYSLFLRKETFFKFNRFYLLAGLPVSLVLALCQYRYPVVVNLPLMFVSENTLVQATATTEIPIDWKSIIFGLYVLGVLIFLIHHVIGLNKIRRLIRKRESNSHKKPVIINIPGMQASFSCFGYVFMDKNAGFSDIERNLILEHETAHVEQYHWIDLLLVQIVCALQWFNPFIWLYRNSIKQNHEFLADQTVVQKGNSQAVYHAALINYTLKTPVFALTNSFAYYNKFKRITMMKKNASKPAKKLAVLLLVPALATFLWAFAQPEYRYSIPAQPESEKMIEDSVISISSGKMKDVTTVVKQKVKEIKQDTISGIIPPGIDLKAANPLTIVDGKECDYSAFEKINPIDIHSISVMKDELATQNYGDKGKNGVVIITTKKQHNEETLKKVDQLPFLLIVDGKECDHFETKDYVSIEILYEKSAIAAYGEKGKNGVLIVKTKGAKSE